MSEKRCPQCWQVKPWPTSFIGARGKPIGFCTTCRERYAGWDQKSPTERLEGATVARRDPKPTGRMLFTLRSHNKKTGPIPVSISERGTCPSSCSFYEAGCYASYGKLGAHWRGRGTAAHAWMPWEDFLYEVAVLPPDTLWRHNEAGDLRGTRDGRLDRDALGELVDANLGRRGFTFTHRTGKDNWEALEWANRQGFTVNLSADTLEEADALVAQDTRPVAVVLPADAPPKGLRTPGGRRVVVCPAQTTGITCAECELCAKPDRHSIVGFLAHGQASALVPEIVKRRLPLAR